MNTHFVHMLYIIACKILAVGIGERIEYTILNIVYELAIIYIYISKSIENVQTKCVQVHV